MIPTTFRTRAMMLLAGMMAGGLFPQNCDAQAVAPPGAANVNGLDVKCELGFTNLCDVTRPTSLSLLLSNYTGKPIEGRLRLFDRWQGTSIDMGEVYLSETQVRRFGGIYDLSEWNDAQIELRDLENELLWSQELLLNKYSTPSGVCNYVMVVGDGQRKSQFESVPLFEDQVDLQNGNNFGRGYRYQNQAEQYWSTPLGTQIQTVNAATWQLPTHHAPLLPLRAIVFPDYVDPGQVNGGQWKAIAEWICLGGRFYVNTKSKDAIEDLLAASPLSDEPAFQRDSFSVRRIGAGAICEYSDPLFLGNSEAAEKTVAAAIAKLTPFQLTDFASIRSVPYDNNRETDRNRMWIMILFLMYTLLSGVVVLTLFRRTRRQLTVYVMSIVGAATIGAGILGANLRYSKGEMRWITISQPGTAGGVQIARMEATSSGARSSVVTVSGTQPDLQVTNKDVRNHYSYDHKVGPFNKQMNLLKNDDLFQSSMTITPWGQRHLYATDFSPEIKKLGLKLAIDEKKTVSLNVTNHLPADLSNCRVVIMKTTDTHGSRQRYEQSSEFTSIAAGQTRQIEFKLNLRPHANNATGFSFPEAFNLQAPTLNRRNGIQVFVIGKLSGSLSLKIDESRSDFNVKQDVHLFVQELLPEEFPARSEFKIPPTRP